MTKNTTWVSCTMNGDGGNLLQYLKSGEKVYVRGNLSSRIFVGHDGQRHAGLNISVTEIELVGSKAKFTPQEVYQRLVDDVEFNKELTDLCNATQQNNG